MLAPSRLLPRPLLSRRKFSNAKSLLLSFISSDRCHSLLLRSHSKTPLNTFLNTYIHACQPLIGSMKDLLEVGVALEALWG
ncbi:hypothetical protein VNO78_19304 [Psophocarpus tetragonolobus]|uniref:Uncharacterized protein n=1 Tax=Psophocarpus tetragonolobus TaxID=3891 RepID=A0AAN9S8I0_PSOTE